MKKAAIISAFTALASSALAHGGHPVASGSAHSAMHFIGPAILAAIVIGIYFWKQE